MLARYEGRLRRHDDHRDGRSHRLRSGSETPEHNYIDTLVYQKLQRVKILPSELCTDAEFIRRVYLDLTGLPPQPEQVDGLPDRRPRDRASSATS